MQDPLRARVGSRGSFPPRCVSGRAAGATGCVWVSCCPRNLRCDEIVRSRGEYPGPCSALSDAGLLFSPRRIGPRGVLPGSLGTDKAQNSSNVWLPQGPGDQGQPVAHVENLPDVEPLTALAFTLKRQSEQIRTLRGRSLKGHKEARPSLPVVNRYRGEGGLFGLKFVCFGEKTNLLLPAPSPSGHCLHFPFC